MMAGTVVMYRDYKGFFMYQVRAANGMMLVHSATYASKAAMQRGLDKLIEVIDTGKIIDRTKRGDDYNGLV